MEDNILNIQIMLSSSLSTIVSLRQHLEVLLEHSRSKINEEANFEREALKNGFSEVLEEAKLDHTKSEVLLKRTQGASTLLSDLLDYENAYSLRTLAEDSRKDNYHMRVLTEKTTQDSASIKIITIITVVFLPATVVAVSRA